MKKLAACIGLLIVVAVAWHLMRQAPSDSFMPEFASVPEAGIEGKLDISHDMNEVRTDAQVSDLVPSLASETLHEAKVPIAGSSQAVTNRFYDNNEAPMKTPEHGETISAVDADRLRFVSIAYDAAKQGMEIADTNSAIVEYGDDIVIVTFPFPRHEASDRPPYPGPSYLARVKIKRSTGTILEVLVAP